MTIGQVSFVDERAAPARTSRGPTAASKEADDLFAKILANRGKVAKVELGAGENARSTMILVQHASRRYAAATGANVGVTSWTKDGACYFKVGEKKVKATPAAVSVPA
jgi:hypothetical protein